ncbi:MAG TPA: ABC transporter permease [Ilumatobacter sp.]|nr:ABC transporter permease [Ilumatobacter sp.]
MTARFPSSATLAAQQVKYQLLIFWRSPVAVFFTLGLPVFMLVLFNALFGDGTVEAAGGEWSVQQFYTGGLAAFTAVSATYTNLVNVVPIRRDTGILKRWRSTPMPLPVYLGGWVSSAVVIAFGGVVLQLTLGIVAYDLSIDTAKVPAMIVTFLVGVVSFAALGLGVASLVPNQDSAPAVANATILPLAFVSDTFIPLEDAPSWLKFADYLPLKPFVNAFQGTLNPFVEAPAFDLKKLGIVAVWGMVGLLLASAKFSWEPSSTAGTAEPSRSRRRRQANA